LGLPFWNEFAFVLAISDVVRGDQSATCDRPALCSIQCVTSLRITTSWPKTLRASSSTPSQTPMPWCSTFRSSLARASRRCASSASEPSLECEAGIFLLWQTKYFYFKSDWDSVSCFSVLFFYLTVLVRK